MFYNSKQYYNKILDLFKQNTKKSKQITVKKPIIQNLSLGQNKQSTIQPIIKNLSLGQKSKTIQRPNILNRNLSVSEQKTGYGNISHSKISLKTIQEQLISPEMFYAWYDASDASTITTSVTSVNSVDIWRDKSVRNNHLTVTTSRPKYNTLTVNGLNVVEFPTLGNYISNTYMDVPSESQTWFIVCGVGSTIGNAAAIMSYMTRNPDNGSSSWQIYSYDNECFIGALGRGPSNNPLIFEYEPPRINGGACLDNNYHLFEIVYDRTTQITSIYFDGILKHTKSDTRPFTQLTGGIFRVFVNRANLQFCTGSVGEIICMSGADASQREMIEYYLKQKWAI